MYSAKRAKYGVPMAIRAPRGRLNRRVGGYLGIESKFVDQTFSASVVLTQAGAEMDPPGAGAQTTPGCISGVAQGDGESNRDGRKCVLTSVHVKGNVTIDASSGSSLNNGAVVRVLLVQDKQTNGVQLNSEDVLLSATHVEYAYRNLQHARRFNVLWDRTFDLNKTAGAGDGTADDSPAWQRSFTINKKFKIPVLHDGTTANITSITDNSLHVLAFASTGATTLNYESRVRFQG